MNRLRTAEIMCHWHIGLCSGGKTRQKLTEEKPKKKGTSQQQTHNRPSAENEASLIKKPAP